jgi:hypothetical protein
MSAALFDTLALVKTLQTKGFQAEQAEGISDALKDALAVAEIATKHDIEESREATQRDIKELRLEFKAENANIRAENAPLKWAIGVCVAGIIPLVFKAFF